eukprot:m.149147 g.149147  ORF g.149147 m.149147 type:complete len:357 (+) comp30641_c0_seq1:1174-2244(+)
MSAPMVNKAVQVNGTSRDDLNGQQGVAESFDDAKGRYVVRLTSGATVSLKPSNLVVTDSSSSDSGAASATPSWIPKLPKFDLAQLRGQAQMLLSQFLPGVKVETVMYGLAVFFSIAIVATMTLGLMPGAFIMIILQGILIWTFKAAMAALPQGGVAVVKAVFKDLGEKVSAKASTLTGTSYVSPRIAQGIIVVVTISVVFLLLPGGVPTPVPTPFPNEGADAHSHTDNKPTDDAPSSDVYVSKEYEAGWRDHEKNNTYGASMPPGRMRRSDYQPVSPNAGSFSSSSSSSIPPSSSSSSSSSFSLFRYMPLMLMASQAYQLGGSPWSAQVFLANFKQLPPWRIAVLVFAVASAVGFF